MTIKVLIDVSSLIYRAFYSLDPSNFKRPSDGLSNNAVYGIGTMTLSMLSNISKKHSDIHPIACFDSRSCNIGRKTIESTYKANRKSCPEQLIHQFPWVKELFQSLDIPCIEVDGHEADDIIATFCKNSSEHTIIASPDKDMTQLVTENNIQLYNPKNKEFLTTEALTKKYGIQPTHFPLYQALIGDSVDNIKGIKGIGPKTAVKIIQNCDGSLEDLKASKTLSEKYVKLVLENIELITKNLSLVTLKTDLKIPSLQYQNFTFEKKHAFGNFLNKMEIKSTVLWKYAKI
tara:strand:+ start:2191 stop:3057 length:867 start_codon:yes stop_codon:yes gene_type:complete